MSVKTHLPLIAWSLRDLLRHPVENGLLGLSLFFLTLLCSVVLLFSQALSSAAEQILADAPALVVRRIGAGGWLPLPARRAEALAGEVPGVVRARARVWGTADGPFGVVTVYGWGTAEDLRTPAGSGILPPGRGEAIAGSGLSSVGTGGSLELKASSSMRFTIGSFFSPAAGLVAHDLVLLHPQDAAQLLGLPAGYASDLALDVFHEQEADALRPDLARAFPWPIQIVTRDETIGLYEAGFSRRSALAYFMLVPSILALLVIVVATVRKQIGRRHEIGLLRALGWTGRHILLQQIIKSCMSGIPAVAAGILAAYSLVFWPGTTWMGALLFGWQQHPPALYLEPEGIGLPVVEIGVLVFAPYLTAAVWTALMSVSADPQELLDREYM
jgi:hypothetical protein